MDFLSYPLAFLVLLGILVTFHEFGHYLIARLSGVQVLKFSVGFGKPLWSRVDKRGTEFAVAMIPFGGYVRMLDDRDPEQASLQRPNQVAYMDLHPKWRIAIALGGPVANFILAVLVFAVLAVAGKYVPAPMVASPADDSPLAQAGITAPAEILGIDGSEISSWQEIGFALTRRLGETGEVLITFRDLATDREMVAEVPIAAWHDGAREPDVIGSLGFVPTALSVLGQIVADSPAEDAALKAGDWVVRAGDQEISHWSELVSAIEKSPGQALPLEYMRNGVRQQAVVYPGVRERGDETVGFLGVGATQRFVTTSLLGAIPHGVAETYDKTALTLMILKKMVVGDVSVKNLSGPLSIAQVAGDSAQYGWRQFFGILAFLSISLGVLNLLPIPILDGGHVIFSSWEWIRGEPVSERVQVVGVQIGLMLVGGLFILATYNDVLRLF
ncbi:MAG: RIP metalloprotease RseP [Pseudomonadales bacterium]|nr:RIP metalloprotease RseP [Pseudomonadales bacterium]